MTYPTLTDVKTFMGVTDNTDDARIQDILDGVIESVEGYCGRVFAAAADTTEYFSVSSPYVNRKRNKLMMYLDVVEVTTLTNGDGVVIASTDYDLWPLHRDTKYEIRLNANSSTLFRSSDGGKIAVLGRFAYSINCPDDVFLEIERLTYQYYAAVLDGAGVEVTNRGVIIDKSQWPQSTIDVLERKKRS